MGLLFITGTDTGVGKTHFTGRLAAALLKRGHKTTTQKWVQCGDLEHPDIQVHDQLMGIESQTDPYAKARRPYQFATPASPHLAAEQDQSQIHTNVLSAASTALQHSHDFVLIEGAGGLMVPLSSTTTTADLLADLAIPTIVVVDNKLGCINHALLTIDALESRRVPTLGLVINHSAPPATGPTSQLITQDNPRIIAQLGHVPILAILPHNPRDEAYIPIAEKVESHAKRN